MSMYNGYAPYTMNCWTGDDGAREHRPLGTCPGIYDVILSAAF